MTAKRILASIAVSGAVLGAGIAPAVAAAAPAVTSVAAVSAVSSSWYHA